MIFPDHSLEFPANRCYLNINLFGNVNIKAREGVSGNGRFYS